MTVQYGDVAHIIKKPETKKELIDYIKGCLTELLDSIPLDELNPDMKTLQVFIKELTSLDGPFCCDYDGTPIPWKMMVGIKFEADQIEKEEPQDD